MSTSFQFTLYEIAHAPSDWGKTPEDEKTGYFLEDYNNKLNLPNELLPTCSTPVFRALESFMSKTSEEQEASNIHFFMVTVPVEGFGADLVGYVILMYDKSQAAAIILEFQGVEGIHITEFGADSIRNGLFEIAMDLANHYGQSIKVVHGVFCESISGKQGPSEFTPEMFLGAITQKSSSETPIVTIPEGSFLGFMTLMKDLETLNHEDFIKRTVGIVNSRCELYYPGDALEAQRKVYSTEILRPFLEAYRNTLDSQKENTHD